MCTGWELRDLVHPLGALQLVVIQRTRAHTLAKKWVTNRDMHVNQHTDKRFAGCKWGFVFEGRQFTNACSLNSFLCLLHSCWKGQLFDSVIFQTERFKLGAVGLFSLLDTNKSDEARLFWMKEVMNWNMSQVEMFGELAQVVDPVAWPVNKARPLKETLFPIL